MDSVENLENKLAKLQCEIDILQKNISLVDTDKKESLNNDKSEVKNNSLEIKQLEKQVGDLEVRIKRQQMNELKLMKEAMIQKGKDTSDLKANSAKELLEKLESRVLDLNIRAKSQLHRLKHLERTFNEENEQLKNMSETCQQDIISTEANCAQKLRHLENVHCKTVKNIEECEDANDKMKKMLKSARKKNVSYLCLLEELKKEQATLAQSDDKGLKEVTKESKVDGQEKMTKEVEKLKHDISLIKDATCCHDIRDIDSAFLQQKATNKDLTEMTKKSEKRLIELKEEKKDLASKRALMKEVDSVYPKRDESLSVAKNRLEEQRSRLEIAKEEQDRVECHTKKTKDVFERLIVKMNPKVNKSEMKKKNVKQLSKQLENIVMYTFPPTGHNFSNNSNAQSSS